MTYNTAKLSYESSDTDLVDAIEACVKTSESYHNELLRVQNEMMDYYEGEQTDRQHIQPFNSDSVHNRMFEAIETIVPIITGSAHQFIAIPSEETDESMARAQRVQKMLNFQYDELYIRKRLEQVSRDIMLKRFGVLEYGWDIETDDIGVWYRDPRTILIPKLRVDAHELPYVIKLAEFDEDEIEAFFPDVDIKDLQTGIDVEVTRQQNNDSDEHVYQIQVVYTPEMIVWRQNDIILKKIQNPYFDFEEMVEEEDDPRFGKIKRSKYDRDRNHLKQPQIPLVFFTPFTTGDAPVASTSLAEVAKPIQDDINVSKRQIMDNMIRMGNGQVYIDSDTMSEEEAQAITNEPGLILLGNSLASENRIRREPPTALPASHFNNLVDSANAFDSVFGTHGAVRGASQNETLGGQMLDRDQNMTRIEQLTQELNRGVNRLANGLVQIMKMYYDEERTMRILGRDGSVEFMQFINSDIENGMAIHTRSGVPPTLDPQARYQQAIQLWQLGALDPETLFYRLEFTDPTATTQKLAAWRAGETLFESQIRQQENQNRAQLEQEMSVDQGGQPGTESAGANQNNQEGRGAEMSGDALSRIREQMGNRGSAPLDQPSN